MGWACGAYAWGEGVYRVLVGKPEGRRPLGRSRRRWVDNIRMDLQDVGCGYMDWIGLAQDRDRWRTLMSAVMNRRVPWNAGNFLTSCKPVSLSRRTLHHGVSKSCYLLYLSRIAKISFLGSFSKFRRSTISLYSFFWVILRRLNFMCRRFETVSSIFTGGANEDGTVSRNVGT